MEIWVDTDINNNNIDNDSYDLLNTYNVKDFPQNSFFHPHGEAPRWTLHCSILQMKKLSHREVKTLNLKSDSL